MNASFVRSGSHAWCGRRSTAADGSSRSSRSSEVRSSSLIGRRRSDCAKRLARRRTSPRSSRNAAARCSSIVRITVSAPTSGCPSMSPPGHEENSRAAGGKGSPVQRSSSASVTGTAPNSTDSKTYRLRRTSSSTRGRARRISSVCHHTVSSSRSSSPSMRARAGPTRGSSRRSSSSATSHWKSSTERRVASVGCAVSTRSTCSRATASRRRSPRSAAVSASDSDWRSPSTSWRRRRRRRSRSSAMLLSCSCSEQPRMIGSSRSGGVSCRCANSRSPASSSPWRQAAAPACSHVISSANASPCCSLSTSWTRPSSSSSSRSRTPSGYRAWRMTGRLAAAASSRRRTGVV